MRCFTLPQYLLLLKHFLLLRHFLLPQYLLLLRHFLLLRYFLLLRHFLLRWGLGYDTYNLDAQFCRAANPHYDLSRISIGNDTVPCHVEESCSVDARLDLGEQGRTIHADGLTKRIQSDDIAIGVEVGA